MRFIYSSIMYLLTPFLLLRLWWKGRHLPAYRVRITERFCWGFQPKASYDLWIHAVSLGEVIAVIPLVDKLLTKQWRLLITTMTPTGAQRVQTYFGDKVAHRYVPYDLPLVVDRFFSVNTIKMGVIVETELWPNLIAYATRYRIPLYLINARLSERSSRGYKRWAFFFRPLLNHFQTIFAQSPVDAQRFIEVGAASKKVRVLGNIKFDAETTFVNPALFKQLKQAWGMERCVLLLASTHDDEEYQLLAHVHILQKNISNIIVLIAPRHPERFKRVYQLAVEYGFNTGLRSKIESITLDNDVIVLDTLGELAGFYQLSDYAFVGGSLVPVGGHNVLEPIAMQVPVITGPHVHNFKAICDDLKDADAIQIVSDAKAVIAKVVELHNNCARKKRLIDNASQILQANKGVVDCYVDEFLKISQETT